MLLMMAVFSLGIAFHKEPLVICLQSRLKEAVQLLEDYKHGTLPPGVTNKEVMGE